MHGTLPLSPACDSLAGGSRRCSHILALDLGKFNSVLCSFDPATAAHCFVSLTTDRASISDVLNQHSPADVAAGPPIAITCRNRSVQTHGRTSYKCNP